MKKYEVNRTVARMRKIGNIFVILVGGSHGKRTLWRTKRKWEYNIKVGPNEIRY